CAFIELSLSPPPGSETPYQGRGAQGEGAAHGLFGAMGGISMVARRHMALYGTKQEHLGAVAVAFRKNAIINPIAQMRKPMTMEDYMNSRWIIEPFHINDCALVSDGGRALIVTSAERARALRQPPVYIMGMGQGHNVSDPLRKEDFLDTGAGRSAETAFKMAGVTPKDIQVAHLYDAATYNVITQLEEYGFCKRGEGGPFVEGGRIERGGKLPLNPSGGQLSEVYIQGWTGPPEIVRQLRGDCGERQNKGVELGLVSNQGGSMNFHSTLILRR
ncbi:MAG: thiolase family protein, partial [Chloroflexi bacterium]|nr:thiolase family protein [Chloroflexota bacterium]